MLRGKRIHIVVGISVLVLALIILFLALGAQPPSTGYTTTTRAEAIPGDIVKVTPSTDDHPPVLNSSEWYDPIPLPGPINTAGAEDSAFILPDGSKMFLFFTPDVRRSPQQQLLDNVTGIWRSDWNGTAWSEPERVWLQDPGRIALDGAAFVSQDTMWFASAREGYTGVNLFTASWKDGRWQEWTYAGDMLNENYQVGEMHISAGGDEMYFHSDRPGGQGGLDLWVTRNVDGQWQEPENLGIVNSAFNDGYPFLSQDGNELWFTRTYQGSPAIFRSLNVNGSWSEPQLIVSSFAGEPTLDDDGNLYFVHHFYREGTMIEADIYVAYRK